MRIKVDDAPLDEDFSRFISLDVNQGRILKHGYDIQLKGDGREEGRRGERRRPHELDNEENKGGDNGFVFTQASEELERGWNGGEENRFEIEQQSRTEMEKSAQL